MAYIGIDLGTTFSAVATIDETGRPKIIHNALGSNITPSCVRFDDNGTAEVGEDARKEYGLSDSNVAGRFKRVMGTSEIFTYGSNTFTPTDLSAFVLKKLVQDASNVIGEIQESVVTIPANFSNEARDATMEAAKHAGLNVKFIINEPTAAALYYAYSNEEELSGIYAVYDLGGGTFDVSIININGKDIEVLSTNGVSKLGGDDFDEEIVKLTEKKYKELTGETLENDDYTKNDAEEEKKSLSNRDNVKRRVNRKNIEITKEEFEEAISSLLTKAEMLCESAIEEANISIDDIKGVLLAGGSTRMPAVKESVRRVFGMEPISTVNPDEVVALGAALYAAYKSDKTHLSALQKTAIESIKVGEATSMCFGTTVFSEVNVTGQGRLENAVVIRKGEKIPCSVTESFFTLRDGQEAIDCDVTESSSPETDPKFVKTIWKGELSLPPGRPAGQQIDVTFGFDQNQIMSCSFVDVATGRKTEVDISHSGQNNNDSNSIDKFLIE
jgi:molecular chaperone DnaK